MKTPVSESLFKESYRLLAGVFIKKETPAYFAKVLRILLLQNISGQLIFKTVSNGRHRKYRCF